MDDILNNMNDDKIYEVIFEDEYNNLYQIGFYHSLKDSDLLSKLQEHLSVYDGECYSENSGQCDGSVIIDEYFLCEYPSTFGMVFDKEIIIDNGVVMVRGFILNKKYLVKEVLGDEIKL